MSTPERIVDPAPGPAVRVGRRTYAIHLTVATGGAATQRNARVGPLPLNSIIRRLRLFHDTTAAGSAQTMFDILIADGDTGDELGLRPTGTSIFVMKPAETGGPGWTLPEYPLFSSINQAIDLYPDIVILASERYLKLHALRTAAGNGQAILVAEVDLYDRPPLGDATGIVPRGTVVDPVCVRVCGVDGGVLGGGEVGSGGPTPPPPPPPPAAVFDPAARPLPAACTIDPVAPLNVTLQVCQVP